MSIQERKGAARAGIAEAAACYIAHVVEGKSIRSIAERANVHPSTIMRRVRKIEAMRDDPVLDQYLNTHGTKAEPVQERPAAPATRPLTPSDEERALLRRLCESGAQLVVAKGLPKAMVMRTGPDGTQTRTAVVDAEVAGAFVLRDWIRLARKGKVNCYEITEAGRMALRRAVAREAGPGGLAEAPEAFAHQHKEWGERTISHEEGTRRLRVNLRESPLTMLARKKGRDGKPFLGAELVDAGERLREDFELAQLGPRVGQNWERFLTGGQRGAFQAPREGGLSAAQDRFHRAMKALGPGLADIALRCCCFLEGLETAEKRMGWSARSGKVVLRIALQRLRYHYDHECPPEDRKIG